MKIFNIQKRKTNKLKRKLNKMVKTLSILNENNLTENQINRIYFINQNIENLQNYIDLLIYELNEKKTNIKENTDIKELKKKDEEAQEILDKFLPLMLYYQMVKH
uniref:Uncharacterized protein n=1 Tax=Mimiviridae sp. ChoanoV1 TaxID=2596887 RepID=A0A5B8HX15_9VIRU|nr:hypothetical protein 7_41 [Mimiviridae sp. ChoanoV1]